MPSMSTASAAFAEGLFDANRVEQVKLSYARSEPYKHAVIDSLIQNDLLKKVKSECQKLSFTEKQTDIYKIHQTGDLASLTSQPPEILQQLTGLLQIRDALYSPAFRNYIRQVTGCGPLSGVKQDMAVNTYTQGCHLLNHDDVIGSRRVSYILYMPLPEDADWRAHWGGALELYAVDSEGQPLCYPQKTIPPAWNQFVFFEVQPGLSHHSVEEVVVSGRSRQRLSISGWFHRAQQGEDGYEGVSKTQNRSTREHLTGTTSAPMRKYKTLSAEELTENHRLTLLEFLNPIYLTAEAINKMTKKFRNESHISLRSILRRKLAEDLEREILHIDTEDGLASKTRSSKIPSHFAGLSNGRWILRGPPHTRRYCGLAEDSSELDVFLRDGEEKLLTIQQLFQSEAFRVWLKLITGVEVRSSASETRRFRPGLDYTLATGGQNPTGQSLEVVLNCTPQLESQWDSEAWGGWECYISSEDDGKDDPAMYTAGEDDNMILTTHPDFNCLDIVLRDPGLLKFVKYTLLPPGMTSSSNTNKNSSSKAVGGPDIRGFFQKGQMSSPTPSSSQQSSKQASQSASRQSGKRVPTSQSNAIVISSDEDIEMADASTSSKKVVSSPKKRAPALSALHQNEREKERQSASHPKSKKRPLSALAIDDSSDEEAPLSSRKTNSPPKTATSSKKRKIISSSSEDEEAKPKKTKFSNTKSTFTTGSEPPAKTAKNTTSVKPKLNWAAAKAAKLAGPSAPGSKIVPDAKTPDCLGGLTLVFTGELSSFSRDEAVELAKRFGGRVTGLPSGATSYVVLGEGAGPKKIETIKKLNISTLDEDQFLNLIATRVGPSGQGGKLDPKLKKKMEKEDQAILAGVKALEKREREQIKGRASQGSAKATDLGSQLWTSRYAPQNLKEICGNKAQVDKLQLWLNDWENSRISSFKKPGKNGMNTSRAVLITGPPGIGKTTSAHLCAKLAGYTPVELNASDARSKKLVENGMNIQNTSLDGWMSGSALSTIVDGLTVTNKTCLIMDEVDGMSAGDRGGVGALTALIRKTKVPVICIANDRTAIKLKPLINVTFGLPFRKPDAAAVRSRMMTVAFKEKMKIPANVVDQLINGAQSDIRQVLNMLSTWKLSSDTMDFDEGTNLAKLNEKYQQQSPFDMTSRLLGPYMFSKTARESLDDKMQLFFQDHAFMPLFIQENYLKTQPANSKGVDGPLKAAKDLKLMEQASRSISDGDLVDALIHGPEQHWSLMPLHAVLSVVRPSSFVYGQGAGYGSQYPVSFPGWLGQGSKERKLSRQLNEMQIRMRLKVSANKAEIRQSYIPSLQPFIVLPLSSSGSSAIPDVIQRMDDYFISKEDWETVVELGVGEQIQKQINTATKTAFTKKYNATEHPIPFYSGVDTGKAPKKLAADGVPDIEEAVEVDEEVDALSEDENKQQDDDLSKDKLLKKAKAPAKTAKPRKSKA